MLQDFNDYLEYRVGRSPYVWGAQGQTFASYEALFAFIERHESGNDEKRALAYAKKLQAAGVPIEEIQVFDCSGLGMYWMQNKMKIYTTDKNANGMYGACTPIKKAELRKGDWVFRGGTGRKYHIGYVVDDALNVVECKGRDDGVIKGPIKGTYWNAFGRPKIFADEINAATGVFTLSRVLKFGIHGDDVKWVQTRLKELGYFKGNPKGNFLTLTRSATKAYQKAMGMDVDGKVGKQTITAMGGVWTGK